MKASHLTIVCRLLISGIFLTDHSPVTVSSEWLQEDMTEEERQIRKFAIENGIWTPDPRSLVGLPDSDDSPRGRLGPNEARYLTRNGSVVTAQAGGVATMPCTIRNVHSSETVSWIRRSDSSLLSLGDQTYSSDDRFTASYDSVKQTWTLTIQHVQLFDSGQYECQLSTHPPKSIFTKLTILQSVSAIRGGPDLYVESGSDVTLICYLKHFTITPGYVFWYHRKAMINFDSYRNVSARILGGESHLELTNVTDRYSGRYSCHPANARPSSVILHIIPGEKPAAIQGEAGLPPILSPLLPTTCTFVQIVLLYIYV